MDKRLFTRLSRFLLLLLPLVCQAQSAAPAQCADPGQSLLWQVESTQLSDKGISIYLFGSIHVGKREFYPLHPHIESLFRSADHLVFEVDPQTASDPQVAMRMQLRGMLPMGQSLPDVVSGQTLLNLEQVLGSMNIPMNNFMNFKPWMIALLLTNLQASALGYDAQNGLENYLMSQLPASTQVLELESMEQQLDMLEALDPELFLDYSLEDFDHSTATMEAMVSAWLCADKDKLEQIIFEDTEGLESADVEEKQQMENLFDKLFLQRNKTMAQGVESFADKGQGSYFVVVGSGHLLGEGSIVELLQQQGYRVSPIRLSP